MASEQLLQLLVDEDGNLPIEEAVAALNEGIREKIDKGLRIDGNAALGLFADQLDYVTASIAGALVNLQGAVIAAHRGLDQLVSGRASEIPEYDVTDALAKLLAEFEIQHLSRTYDALCAVEAQVEVIADDESA